MGFTHYFEKTEKLNQSTWNVAIEDVRKVLEVRKDLICREYDSPDVPYECDSEHIRFNGKGDEGHETFLVKRDTSDYNWNFCKTARKPYNEVVEACLTILAHYFKDDFKVSSDGEWNEWLEGAWEDTGSGVKLVVELFGEDYIKEIEEDIEEEEEDIEEEEEEEVW